MMSSKCNMHCLSLRTQVQLSSNQAVVNTQLHLYTPLHVPGLVRHSCTHMCTQACTHTVTFMQKHTQTHQQCVQKSRACCLQLPSFQAKTWPFTSILVFACANCQAVQTLPGRWCLKAHSVSQWVQVILPKLLTRLVRNGSVAQEAELEFYRTKIHFLWFSIMCGIRWCGSCAGTMARE